MKRFITYLFTYENSVKGKNVGFIRTDERNDLLDMEIHVQGIGRFQGMGQIYILLNGEKMWGVRIGEIPVGQGRGMARVKYDLQDARSEGIAYDEVAGVAIRFGGQYYAASCWMEQKQRNMITNDFEIWQEEALDTDAHIESEKTLVLEELAVSEIGEPERTSEIEEEMPEELLATEEVPEQINVSEQQQEPEQQQSGILEDSTNAQSELVRLATEKLQKDNSCESCETKHNADGAVARMKKLDLSDIRKLPKKNWYLCNNSFLIHGFFNYHYLVVIEMEENGVKKCYLGVPGIYEKPERLMAMLFGFGDFRPESETDDSDPEGKFGYWICLLDV